MDRVRRSAGQCMRAAAPPSMLRSSLASLLETPAVRSCLWRSVELAVSQVCFSQSQNSICWFQPIRAEYLIILFQRRERRSVMTRSSLLLLMFQKKCVISTLRRPADLWPSLCLACLQFISAPLCPRRPVSSSFLSPSRFPSLSKLAGVWTPLLLLPVNHMMKKMLWLHLWELDTDSSQRIYLLFILFIYHKYNSIKEQNSQRRLLFYLFLFISFILVSRQQIYGQVPCSSFCELLDFWFFGHNWNLKYYDIN